MYTTRTAPSPRASALKFLLVGVFAVTGCAGAAADPAEAGIATAGTPTTTDPAKCPTLPEGFAYLTTVDDSIAVDLKYASTDNFTGDIVDGYERANAAVLRADAAAALSAAQTTLAEDDIGLLVFDAFRPTRAVTDFVAWSRTDDDRTRDEYYPSLDKAQLFDLGYIAEQSGHSLGGTVDLTLVDLARIHSTWAAHSISLMSDRTTTSTVSRINNFSTARCCARP